MIYIFSKSEFDILNEAIAHEKCHLKIKPITDIGNILYSIELNENQANELREVCGDYLAIIGFDENYSPNDKGNILEGLIDKLFIA
jgi:hypothetical protein